MATQPLRFDRLPSGIHLANANYTIDVGNPAAGEAAWVLCIHGYWPAGGIAEEHGYATLAEAKAAARLHYGEPEEDPEFALLRRELSES